LFIVFTKITKRKEFRFLAFWPVSVPGGGTHTHTERFITLFLLYYIGFGVCVWASPPGLLFFLYVMGKERAEYGASPYPQEKPCDF